MKTLEEVLESRGAWSTDNTPLADRLLGKSAPDSERQHRETCLVQQIDNAPQVQAFIAKLAALFANQLLANPAAWQTLDAFTDVAFESLMTAYINGVLVGIDMERQELPR